ncbi:hypothetical protein Cgig2_028882 [Carnegiea gigantea]|uniref:Dof zinc finger protein n=1 Tax=Carnegiea gigantea TaxID=171969 RepID=A0A9Q1QNJ3_9CARY|nr:hypothetical protein Cgig2_028882 [Carnegiea gigantea]
MALIPSAPNEWPQNNQTDDQKGGCLNNNNNNNMGSVRGLVMDQKVIAITQNHQQQQQQQQHQQKHQQQNQEPLRCPRCDSTNTKFCYYNNYSLSQPRHFCKACKRYWTRGGTLRNVPVGGGCRKNKRVKRPPNNSSSSCSALTNTSLEAANSATSAPSAGQNIHDLISSASNHVNPLFFGMPTNHTPSSDISFPFSRYDLHSPSQIHGLGLGFSSSSSGLVHSMNGLSFNVQNHPTSKQIFQDLISSNPLISSSNYTNPTTSDAPSPTISSLLASTLQIKGASNNFQALFPSYENDLQMKGSGMFVKDVKTELEGQKRLVDHHSWGAPSQNHQVEDQTSSDPSVLWGGGANNLGAWLDPSNNIGSSVSLI